MASTNGRHAVAPIEFPPPVDPASEFIGPPTDAEDERIEVGVAIVGGGQAGLACAIRLLQLLEDDPELTEKLGEVPVAVIEKGKVAGAHQLSGGVMNPRSIRELLPGDDVMAKATVLAEGCWGHLTGAAQKGLGLAGNDPQVWALGVKEVWEVEKPLEKVMHTLGWPLRPQAKYQEFGGSWIYGMNREGEKPKVSIGFVCGLDNADARISVHDLLQEFKLHPLVKKILEGGKRVAWGAKAIPEGGYWALPRLSHPGMVICGDAGGMVNVPKLKGIHYAIESGRLAAETIYKQLKAGSADFTEYEKAVHEGDIGKDLYESRNMKQPFAKGLIVGGAIVNAMTVTKGRFPAGHWPTHRDAEAWQRMCPAGVYEIPEDAPEEGTVDLIVNPSNCVQCGAITAKGGRLTPPEGGDGPLYQIT